jgi:hypothetical protein
VKFVDHLPMDLIVQVKLWLAYFTGVPSSLQSLGLHTGGIQQDSGGKMHGLQLPLYSISSASSEHGVKGQPVRSNLKATTRTQRTLVSNDPRIFTVMLWLVPITFTCVLWCVFES